MMLLVEERNYFFFISIDDSLSLHHTNESVLHGSEVSKIL